MHKPVLLTETIESFFTEKRKGIFVDATVNRGGHSKTILENLLPSSVLLCIDLDINALNEAKAYLEGFAKERDVSIFFINDNFRNIKKILASYGFEKIDGLLADFGVSSQELDSSERGFSFRFDEPLYMTLKSHIDENDVTAKDVVNTWSYETLVSILYSFSDERYSHRIAKEIVKSRENTPITTTFELIDIIKNAVPKNYLFGKTHFATKTFQAIRMAVNDELGSITDLIDSLPVILKQGGRAALITFHSTEDRLVKHEVRKRSEEIVFFNKKAIVPKENEIISNKRSRSAQLRIIERI